MTHAQQVNDALQLLAPEQRDACLADIEAALRRVQTASPSAVVPSKQSKLAVQRYRKALQRTRRLYAALDPVVQTALVAMTYTPQNNLPRAIEQEIALCGMLDHPLPRYRHDARSKKMAVAAAHELLVRWRHSPTKTRRGKWDRLSAILFGQTGDFFEHMRANN
jgi:hypothetical protein